MTPEMATRVRLVAIIGLLVTPLNVFLDLVLKMPFAPRLLLSGMASASIAPWATHKFAGAPPPRRRTFRPVLYVACIIALPWFAFRLFVVPHWSSLTAVVVLAAFIYLGYWIWGHGLEADGRGPRRPGGL